MKVSEIMTAKAACCGPEDSDNRPAQLMWENDCGVVPVVDGSGRTIGIVTDRDLCMAAYTKGRALTDLRVEDAMSHEIFGCKKQDSVEDALAVMRRHRVRRLPVLDENQRVVGILSVNDVVRAIEAKREGKERTSLMEAMFRTLGAICEHAAAPATQQGIQPMAKARAPATKASEASQAHSGR